MKIPTMLDQYLEDIGENAEDMSKEELLDYATYCGTKALSLLLSCLSFDTKEKRGGPSPYGGSAVRPGVQNDGV